jgi:hypothetical protein
MSRANEFNLHANVNRHGDDVVLRITLTWYDDEGVAAAPTTWRGHTVMPWLESSVDQAHVAVTALAKMLEKQGATYRLISADEPLF